MNQAAKALLASLALAGSLHADLIGDALTIRRSYPNLATNFAPPVSTVIAAGASDAVSPQPHHYTINVEAQHIYFDFHNVSGFGGVAGGVFDGLQFLGMGGNILSVSVVEEIGIHVPELVFGSDFINLNLYGWFNANSSLTLQVITADESPAAVPEPSTFLLAGLGLGALAVMARKRRRA